MSKEITSKTKRIATILSLAETGSVSMQELAERFAVSTRTIQRDFGLIVQAHIPFVSHQQGRLYSFAQGFCLNAVNITAEQAAVWAVSYDIALQLGGNFSVVLKDISARFAPPSFTDCDFYPDTSLLAEPFKGFILSAVKENSVLKLQIKPNNLKLYIRPCKLLRLTDKFYVAGLEKDGNINFIALDDISQNGLSIRGKFKRPPFLEWYVWQCAKQYLGQLPAKFAVAEADGLEENTPAENAEVSQKNVSAQSLTETVSVLPDTAAPASDFVADTYAEPETKVSAENIAATEVMSEGIAETFQNQAATAVTAESNAAAVVTIGGDTEQSQARQAPLVQSEGEPNRQEPAQSYLQDGQSNVFEQPAQLQSAEIKQQTGQEILPETPPDVNIPELSSYSAVLNEELSRFLNADIDSPASGIINIGAQSVKENFFENTPQNNFKNNNTESFIPQEPQAGNNTALPEKEDKSA